MPGGSGRTSPTSPKSDAVQGSLMTGQRGELDETDEASIAALNTSLPDTPSRPPKTPPPSLTTPQRIVKLEAATRSARRNNITEEEKGLEKQESLSLHDLRAREVERNSAGQRAKKRTPDPAAWSPLTSHEQANARQSQTRLETPPRARLQGLEDSLVLMSPELRALSPASGAHEHSESLHLSVRSSLGSSATSALMITMGKLRKKQGHGLLATLRSVDCWLEDNFLKVKGDDDAVAESWDLEMCHIDPPHKLDRIKMRMATNTSGTGFRELNLYANSKDEAQQWLRTIVARQEVIHVQNECNTLLKRAQEVHDRTQHQQALQIEFLNRSAETLQEAWEGKCIALTEKVDALSAELSQWSMKYDDLEETRQGEIRQLQEKVEHLEQDARLAHERAREKEEEAEVKLEEVDAQVATQS